jgi:hypothetical protein
MAVMSILIADDKNVLNVASIFFFYFKLSQRHCSMHCFAYNSQILHAILQNFSFKVVL